MKKLYIGVGGIGCKLLKNFEEEANNDYKYVYLDAVPEDLAHLESGERYALTKQKNGCYQRIVGKDEIKAVIYSGQMPDFIDDDCLEEDFELTFVTSTFGGFGSAVVFELSDYYSVKIKKCREQNGFKSKFDCKVVALPLQSFAFLKNCPQTTIMQFETNEIEFINEFRAKEARKNKWYLEHSDCIPYIELYVPNTSENEPLHSIIGMSRESLSSIDMKERYYYSPISKKAEAEVFISYSSKNQAIADKVVEAARKNGISCWIATTSIEAGSYAKQIIQGIREAKIFVVIVSAEAIESPHVKNELDFATSRIKDGLVIMPFKIDDADLDDECQYYLGRQEFFWGKQPPIEDRIDKFIEKIKTVLKI